MSTSASCEEPVRLGSQSSISGRSTGSCCSGTGTIPSLGCQILGIGGPQYRCREINQSLSLGGNSLDASQCLALPTITYVQLDIDSVDMSPEQRKLSKAVAEFGGYIRANATWIPNYGERWRTGEAISSAFVKSAVNHVVSKRMLKKQQM